MKLYQWQRLIRNSSLHSTTKLVLFVLSTYMKGERMDCCPGQDLIAEGAGLGVRAVRKHLRLAEEAGWLQRSRRHHSSAKYNASLPQVNRHMVPVHNESQPAYGASSLASQPAYGAGQKTQPAFRAGQKSQPALDDSQPAYGSSQPAPGAAKGISKGAREGRIVPAEVREGDQFDQAMDQYFGGESGAIPAGKWKEGEGGYPEWAGTETEWEEFKQREIERAIRGMAVLEAQENGNGGQGQYPSVQSLLGGFSPLMKLGGFEATEEV